MHFPPPATDKIGEPLHDASANWTDVHTVFDVNGHIQSRWIRSTGQWSRPELVRDPMLHIHGLAPVINYGQAAFEGLKAFRAPNGDVNIVRPEWHAARMAHSSALVSIPPLSEDHFLACIQLAVGHNAEYVPPHDCEGMLYIRPVVFGSGPSLALDPPDEFLFCVFVATAAALHGADPIRALVLDEFDRAAPRGTGSGKVAGNYAPVMRWSNVARHQGFDITLHLDSQTRTEIEEFSTSAFVGIKVATGPDGGSSVTLIVPDTKNIVNSVSCDSVQQLARSLGWRVERRPVKYEELSELTEVIACGTAVSIISIKSITRKSVSDEIIYGSTIYAQRLVTGLRQIYKGDVADRFDWLTQLERPADLDLHLKPSKTNGRMDSESSSLQLNGH